MFYASHFVRLFEAGTGRSRPDDFDLWHGAIRSQVSLRMIARDPRRYLPVAANCARNWATSDSSRLIFPNSRALVS
jgi:predicted nucleic acid-binding protein